MQCTGNAMRGLVRGGIYPFIQIDQQWRHQSKAHLLHPETFVKRVQHSRFENGFKESFKIVVQSHHSMSLNQSIYFMIQHSLVRKYIPELGIYSKKRKYIPKREMLLRSVWTAGIAMHCWCLVKMYFFYNFWQITFYKLDKYVCTSHTCAWWGVENKSWTKPAPSQGL